MKQFTNNRSRSRSVGNVKVDVGKLRANIKNTNPLLLATLRNAVPHNGETLTEKDHEGNDRHINPSKLTKLSDIISNNVNSISDLREITSYIDKADLLWRTILLYPNGKQEKILNYDTISTNVKNAGLHNVLLPIWSNYFTNDYKIETRLPDIVSDVLINTGSFILFNLSRPGLDYLINGSELDNRSGNETYRQQAINHLKQEFKEHNGKVLARNKGVFVRDPNSSNKTPRVSGLESLLANDFVDPGLEFNIFNDLNDNKELINITLTDNPAIIYLHKLQETRINNDINRVMGVESIDSFIRTEEDSKRSKKPSKPNATTANLTEEQVKNLHLELYPEREVVEQSFQYVKENDALSQQPYGRGLTFEVPSEAVIPIHINGNSKQQVDFIILFDDEGNFLKNTSDAEYYQGKPRDGIVNKNKTGSENQIIAGLKQIHSGAECDFDMKEFSEIIKQSIIRRFMASVVSGKGDSVSITIDEEVNKIFLSRIFKRQGVRCLYVPGEAVTYIALKYNKMGLGQSLVTNAKLHIARLAAYDIADALANIESAQAHTLMTITPEENDSDPHQSVAIARAAFFESNPRLHSLLSTAQLSVPQIVDSIRESSLTTVVNTSENKHMATPDIDITRMDKEHFKPVDDNSRQAVLNQISNYLSLPKSWLDISEEQNNFKIEAITENEMVFNQAVTWQEELADQLMDFQRKHIRVNAHMLKLLIETIKDNKKLWKPDSGIQLEGDEASQIKTILSDFLNSVYCEFPTPFSSDKTDKLVDSLTAVEKLVDAWMDMSGVDKTVGKVLNTLGIDAAEYSNDEIKDKLRSALLTEAFKRFNLPMPYDEAVSGTMGGGINTLVQMVINQHTNAAEFIARFLLDKVESDKQIIKQYKKKLDKKLASIDTGDEGLDNEDITTEGDDPETQEDDNLDMGDEGGEEGDDTTADDEGSDLDDTVEDDDSESDSDSGSDDPDSPDYNPFG